MVNTLSSQLLNKFIENEPKAAAVLLDALNNQGQYLKRGFNFNLFDINIDFETGQVEIIDVCHLFDASGASQSLPIEFVLGTLHKSLTIKT